jgi:hypothetical protein
MTLKYNDALIATIETAVKQGVGEATEVVRDEVFRLVLETPKTGRLYDHPNGGVHQASAPGESFANMTGNALSKTVTFQEDDGMTGVVAGDFDYALELEMGTSRVAERPTFRPALNNSTDEIVDAIETSIRSAL